MRRLDLASKKGDEMDAEKASLLVAVESAKDEAQVLEAVLRKRESLIAKLERANWRLEASRRMELERSDGRLSRSRERIADRFDQVLAELEEEWRATPVGSETMVVVGQSEPLERLAKRVGVLDVYCSNQSVPAFSEPSSPIAVDKPAVIVVERSDPPQRTVIEVVVVDDGKMLLDRDGTLNRIMVSEDGEVVRTVDRAESGVPTTPTEEVAVPEVTQDVIVEILVVPEVVQDVVAETTVV